VALIFPRWTNWLPLLLVLGAPPAGIGAAVGVWYFGAPQFTDVGYSPEQPVAYSHALHAGELGIDCRYCHNTVEQGAAAAVPPVDTCMNCHKVIKPESKRLEPIRQAYAGGDPVKWVRVHMLPDYSYFNHSVHVAAGVGCVSCHGRVDQMVEVAQQEPLSMLWCLKCHRHLEENLRPPSEVTNMDWTPEDSPDFDPVAAAAQLDPPEHCSGCHR